MSRKIAQNERTLYTFLTRDENGSLKRFLEEQFKNETTLLMPYNLYQYFSPLIEKDVGIGGSYKIQLMAEEALQKIEKKDDVSKQVISLIALCSVIKDSQFTPLTENFISSCFNQLYSKSDIKNSLKSLKSKKVLFYNRNTGHYLLQEGTPVDIDEEISKLRNITLTSKSLVQVLKRYFKTDFIVPKKYNFDHTITRFYRTEIISVEELRSLRIKKVDFYKEDGLVFYVIPFSHDELRYAKSEVKKILSPLTIFVLPKRFIECKKDIEELNAVDCLYNNKEILSASTLVKKELDRHKEILLSSIHSLLKPLIGYMKLSAHMVYLKSNFHEEICHFKELQRHLGNLFEKEYNKYVSFNLEYMNRHSVSGSITLGRKKFIDLLRRYKTKPLGDIYKHIEGRGPNYAILDTMNHISSFKYNDSEKVYHVSHKLSYYKFFNEYRQILSKYPEGVNVNDLLNILVSPPYGFRLGVLPVFIALADLCFKQPISHYFDEAYVKELDGDHYDLLMKYPKKTIIHYTPINDKQQKFLDELAKIFQASDMSIRSIIESLAKWRKGIPESTKLSTVLSEESRKILIQIDSSKEPNRLLFERIPDCFGKPYIDSEIKINVMQDILLCLKKSKKEIDETYRKLLLRIKSTLISFIKLIDKHYLNGLLKSSTLENNLIKNFQSVLVQIKDYPFSTNTNRFIGRALKFDSSNYNQYFLETIADVLTGVSPRYWSDKGYFKFEFTLKQIKLEVELACEIASPYFKGKSVLAFIDKGENKKTFIKLGSQSSIEEHIKDPIRKIKVILDSFDEAEKRKIIVALLISIDEKIFN